ncbi:MAG TPA: hypothetical protein VFV64_10690 [Permianibacter sp.]|nr:hypothetical protein [Permianibacter sp.]
MDERRFRLVFIGIVLLQLIGTALLALQQHRQQEQLQQQLDFFAATLARSPTVTASSTITSAAYPLPQQLRELIRAELKQRPVENSSTAKPAVTAAAKREQELQFANSDAVLSGALASGRWTLHDTEALIPHLSQLSTAQRVQLLERFHAAVNRQELELEDIPPL